MEYHDVLPNISLCRMSVRAYDLAWKKSTLGKNKNIKGEASPSIYADWLNGG